MRIFAACLLAILITGCATPNTAPANPRLASDVAEANEMAASLVPPEKQLTAPSNDRILRGRAALYDPN